MRLRFAVLVALDGAPLVPASAADDSLRPPGLRIPPGTFGDAGFEGLCEFSSRRRFKGRGDPDGTRAAGMVSRGRQYQV